MVVGRDIRGNARMNQDLIRLGHRVSSGVIRWRLTWRELRRLVLCEPIDK